MSTAVEDACLVSHPLVRSHGGMYVHQDMPQQVYFRMASNSFQASGESVRRKDISYSSNEAPTAIPKGIYLHENQLRYYDLKAPEKNLKRLNHHNPMQRQGSEYLKQSTAKVKECYLTSEQVRRESSPDKTHLHNKPPSGIQKIVRVENFPDSLVCLPNNGCPAIEARRSTMQYESRQQIQLERYRAQQNGHHLHETECLSEKRVIYLKPSGYQTETTSVPMTMGNPLQLSNNTQFRPRYPANIQNPKVSTSAQGPKHPSHCAWPNLASVVHEEFPRQGNNGELSEVPPQDSDHFHSLGSPYSVSQPESDVNSAQCQAPGVVASNTVQPVVLFVCPEGPTVLNYSSGRNHPPTPQMAPDIPSASTYRIASGDAHHPRGKLLSSGDSNVTKCHGHCETPKYDSAALPVHPIPTNTVPTDAHLLSYSPGRQLPVYRQEEPIENCSQKAHCFPFRVVYVPSDANCVTAPRPCHTRDVSCQAWPTEDYTTRDFRQPVSNSAGQSSETNERLQHTTRAPSSFGPSQVNGLAKVPMQYSCQSAPEGFCRPMRRECSAPDHRTDLMSCVHPEAPSYSKSSAIMTAPTGRPNCAPQPVSHSASAHVITTSNPHFESLNGHVPSESNNISWSKKSAFHKVFRCHDTEIARDGPHLEVNPWIVPKQHQHNINSEDSFDQSHGRRRSSWSDNISSLKSPHIRWENPKVSLHGAPVNENLLATKEPRCYISVDSKPQVDKEKEQSNISNSPRRFHEIMRPHEERMSSTEQEQPESKLEKLTKFVVGVESKIQWNKVGAYEKSKPKTSEVKDLQIVSISSTHSPRDESTTPPNSSGSESEDPLCMIRLERVYYSKSAIPSRLSQSSANTEKQGSKVADCNVEGQVRESLSLPSETRQTIFNGEHSSKKGNLAPFENKAEKYLSADKNIHKTAHGSADGPVKRKANVSSAMINGDFGVKRKKMMKTKSTVPPKGTEITAFGKGKTSLEIRSTKNLTVRLEDGKPEYKSEKKETCIIQERIRKRCARTVRINS